MALYLLCEAPGGLADAMRNAYYARNDGAFEETSSIWHDEPVFPMNAPYGSLTGKPNHGMIFRNREYFV